ncbi:MAG: DUF1559 domain-containing protein [Phycisphaerae bacterium]
MRASVSRGFTLIELLVVIAIIALLVSILVPALSAARELARIAVCKQHLRSVGTGMHLYVSTWNSIAPPGYWDTGWYASSGGSGYVRWWMDGVAPFIDGECMPNSYGRDSVALQPADGVYDQSTAAKKTSLTAWYWQSGIRFSRMLNCPSRPLRRYYSWGTWQGSHYMFNNDSVTDWSSSIDSTGARTYTAEPRSADRIAKPQQLCKVMDGVGNIDWSVVPWSTSWGSSMQTRYFSQAFDTTHMDSVNGVMWDGHVESWTGKYMRWWITYVDPKYGIAAYSLRYPFSTLGGQ